jgi:hypothetical protein
MLAPSTQTHNNNNNDKPSSLVATGLVLTSLSSRFDLERRFDSILFDEHC